MTCARAEAAKNSKNAMVNNRGKKHNKPVPIAVIGYGIVGQALAYSFSRPKIKKDYLVSFYDEYKESSPLDTVVKKSDFIFICLPTPMKLDESGIDLSIIEDVISKITLYTNGTDKIIVIKSTVAPGTTVFLEKKYPKTKFAFSPEFLAEAQYLKDAIHPDRIIIGAYDNRVLQRVTLLFKNRFPKTKIFTTDPTTAEMVKYMANMYLATKVIFGNEMFDMCQKLGIPYEEVKTMVVADHRIYDSHLTVTPERGFGGKCFPKDMIAFLGAGKERGVNLELLSTVWKINKRIRKVRDWEGIPFAVSQGKKGISFAIKKKKT
ncbi:MAG: hypothetical protein U1D31_00540 [Patescibacteria group bacterium]|nr:hypothetical protein [bacterium]MDZ4240609.1 hypothetical protein [Patescibacteria group bacterium]